MRLGPEQRSECKNDEQMYLERYVVHNIDTTRKTLTLSYVDII